MRVTWTRPAVADVLQIRDYIATDSPRYARIVAERLFASVVRLTKYPLSGRVVPELNDPSLREVVDAPYRIVYRVGTEALEILTVVHAALRFPADVLRSQP